MTSEDIASKLDTLIRLFAHTAMRDYETNKDKILFLGRAGIGTKEIAEIVGTSPNTVSVALSVEKKSKKKTTKKPKP